MDEWLDAPPPPAKPEPVSWENTTVRHGTQSGWRLHQHLGERPCDPCYRAKAAYDAERKSQPAETIKSRISAAAQRRALTELSHRHKAEYDELYVELKRQAFEEAGLIQPKKGEENLP